MKNLILFLSLLLAPSALADDLITSWGYSTSTKQVQAQTRSNGWIQVQTVPKQYVVGTASTNGTPTITCTQTGWAVTRGVFVPYQTYDGTWRLRFNGVGTFTSASVGGLTLTFTGVTFKNVASYYQSFSASALGNSNATFNQVIVIPGGATANINLTSALTWNGTMFSGDVELDSKPTWAD